VVPAPDVHDKHTLSQLARMAGNAYALPDSDSWYDLEPTWNRSFPIGWQNPTDGFRGHVFVSADNNTVVLAIKGTTLFGPTSKADKLNDNLLFSCCCAFVDFTWVFSTVCHCCAGLWRCDNTCLSLALIKDSLFYTVGVNLVTNVTVMFPFANIYLVGHSLGGALASLLGTTFGYPAVAFEAPGERLASTRLHLPIPPSMRSLTSEPNYYAAPVTHVYHTADPIPQGTCTGVGSLCAETGYALETKCHLGKSIVYDTVTTLGWNVHVRKHPIKEIIHNVVEADVLWGFGQKVPKAREERNCVECYKWDFGYYKRPGGASESNNVDSELSDNSTSCRSSFLP